MNAMPNIIYVIMAGGLSNIVLTGNGTRMSDRRNDRAARIANSWETAAQYRAEGRRLKNSGQPLQAVIAWEQSLELIANLAITHPGEVTFHQQWCDCANDLAWLLANTPDPAAQNADRAVLLALKNTEAYPASNAYWNTLAACYYRNGDYKAANAALERGVKSGNGGTVFDYILIAMTQARLGNEEQARRWFDEATRLIGQQRSDHPELRPLFDEAHRLLQSLPEAVAIVP